MISPNGAILSGLGPITKATPPTGTAPLTGSGILNGAALGTTATLVYAGPGKGRAVRVKIACVTASRALGWAVVGANGSAPTIKADQDGSADEGSLVIADAGGGQYVEFGLADTLDLYLVASDADTAYQLTVTET